MTAVTSGASTFDPASYDHNSTEYAQHWRAMHDDMRSACPVAHSQTHEGFYVLTRYEDVAAAIKDDATFASVHRPGTEWKGITVPESPTVSTPIEMDPPEYLEFRKLLNKPFSPEASRSWGPWLRDVATALIDAFVTRGKCDLVTEFASPLPAFLTAKLLGLPLEDWRLYSDAAHDIVRLPVESPQYAGAVEKWVATLHRAAETAERRRAAPEDDLLSTWVHAVVNGEAIDKGRIVEMCSLMIAGGNDTTTSLFTQAFAWLSEHPEQKAWLAEEPSRIDAACEEFLRYFTPTQALGRTVTRDVEFAGHQFHRGDRVLLSFAAANFDPEAFEEPNELRLDRFPNRHQAFGLGVHRCLGSNFTRVEFKVGLIEILRRIPDFEVDVERSEPYARIGTVNGWDTMPATFTPGEVVGSPFEL